MRRRLVLSTLAVVIVVMAVLLAPVFLVVNTASNVDEEDEHLCADRRDRGVRA